MAIQYSVEVIIRDGPRGYNSREMSINDLLGAAFGQTIGTVLEYTAQGWQATAGAGGSISLTTVGLGGAATLSGGVLNIPVYQTATYPAPAFTAFGITGFSSPVEVGYTTPAGSETFTWTTSNSGNVNANSISIVDATTSTTLATGLANTGSDVITLSGITNTSPASHTWTISGVNSNSGNFSANFTVNWEWRVFYGNSSTPELTASAAQALSASALQTVIAGTYAEPATGYKWVVVPTSFSPPNTFTDTSSGFAVPMCTTANDSNFTGTDGNGNNYLPLTLVNAYSVSDTYAAYRTQNSLGGALNLKIT